MRIGVVGAGMIGSTLAKLWVNAGHEVQLASRHPGELLPLVERIGRAGRRERRRRQPGSARS